VLWCGYAGSSLEVKIETDSNDAVGIKTEADSSDAVEIKTEADSSDRIDYLPSSGKFTYYD